MDRPTLHDETRDEPAASDFLPYGRLVKMLLPSCGEVAIHDSAGELLWSSAGYERPTLRALADKLVPAEPEPGDVEEWLTVAEDGTPAFICALRDESGTLLGSLVVALSESQGSDAKASMISSLLRPLCQCLVNRMSLERTVVERGAERAEQPELLLGPQGEHPDALQRLLEHCRSLLGAELAILSMPSEGLLLSCAASSSAGEASDGVIEKLKTSLLAWLRANDRPMRVNRVSRTTALPAYKLIACPIRDARDHVQGFLALFRAQDGSDFDDSDLRIVEFTARKVVAVLASERDALTGLMNRLIFTQRGQRMLREAGARGCALVYLDVDRLQQANDAFGFAAGDEVLARCAGLMAAHFGGRGITSRVGGDRFAALLPEHEREQAQTLARELIASVAELVYLRDGERIPITASCGVAAGREDTPIEHLMAAAERACKRAKQAGRNRVGTHLPDDTLIGLRRPSRGDSAELEAALDGERFRLDGQPIVGLGRRAGEFFGYEVLVRMRDSSGALVAPDKFLGAATRLGLMPALDRWVLRSSIALLKTRAHVDAMGAGRLAINVSTQSLLAGGYAELALAQLEEAGVPPTRLCFELKESSAVHHLREAAELIEKLVAAGSVIALDDFGSGLSSLAHLKDLPVQYLKIDGGFVRRSPDDRIAASIVAGIAEAAKSLGVDTIAEHVESEPVLAKLSDLGVDFGQGFILERPQPLEQILAAAAA